MKKNIYGKKMFVADLLIVSLWALFAWHFSWGTIMTTTMIALRIALSFMMYRKSRWAFPNAVIYAIMFIGMIFDMPSNDLAFESVEKIAYVTCCLFGYSDWVIKTFDNHICTSIEIPLYILWGIYSAWLFIMPIVCSWNRKSIISIFKYRRKILWYIGAVVALIVYLYFGDMDATFFIGGLLLSATPLAYRIIYRKDGLSILQSIVQDRVLMHYVAIASVMFGAVLIGLYEVNAAKPFAAFFFPIILYILALRISRTRTIKTIPALMLGIAGFLQILVYNRFHDNVILLLSISGGLSCIGVFLTYRKTRSIFSSILLLVASTFVLPLSLLGYNPYAAINVNDVRSLRGKTPFRYGIYEFQQNGSLGLRDRYGIVLYANYDRLEFLGDGRYERDYMVLYKYVKDWEAFAIENIYDLKNRQFVFTDKPDVLYRIEEIREKIYAIYDHDGNQVYTLSLPGIRDWGYDSEMHLIACYDEEAEVQLPDDLSGMTITKSDDGKLALYTYDTEYGGTSPAYETYIRYQSNDSIITDYLYPLSESVYVCSSDIKKDGVEVYEGSFSKIVAQIPVSDNETGYIIDAYNRDFGHEGGNEAVLVKFVDGKLKKLQFVTKSGAISNSVGCYYYIGDWYYTTDGLGWDWVMSFDKETNILYVPEDNGSMVIGDRYDLYRYSDGKMRYIGNDAGFWLHPSLHDFKCLIGIYQTDDYLIRIDELCDHSYRYAAWSKPDPMSSKPDLVLYNGNTEIIDNAIVFYNGNYAYIVPKYHHGQGKDFGKVIVKYMDKIIYESEV